VAEMSKIMVELIGRLRRCTSVAEQTVAAVPDGAEGSQIPPTVAVSMLTQMKLNNDEVLEKCLGYAKEECAFDGPSILDIASSEETFSRRVSSGPAILQSTSLSQRDMKRSLASSTSPLRSCRSPRKSLRSSLSAPYRKVSDKEKKGLKTSKNVRWGDEVAQSDLHSILMSPVVATSTPESGSRTSVAPKSPFNAYGSESEWEDEIEKTDDSVQLSVSLPASSGSARPYASLGVQRPRPSRLDPSFLKSKTRASVLGSLYEDEETPTESPQRHISQPLTDRLNRLPALEEGPIRKTSGNRFGSHRVSSTPKASSKSRRRSGIGSHRGEKVRRRSSMIPQLSPAQDNSMPRRVVLSPAKRVKRSSLSKSTTSGALRSSVLSVPLEQTFRETDTSFSKSRPTWR
jgi:kinesin family member 18/19